MNQSPRKTTVTLEDLLRLKRAEQPPAEFWAQFEEGLRAKQLAAIIEPRPWWAPFIRLGTRMARYQLPVGATAILALTLLTIREYHPISPVPSFAPVAAETAAVEAPLAAADEKAVAPSVVSAPAVPDTTLVAAVNAPAPASAPASQPAPAATTLGTSSHVAMVNAELSAARYAADGLAAARATDPLLDQMLGHALPSVDSSSPRGEPLAQISVPDESPRSRLLGGTAWLASLNTRGSALRTNDEATRHLTEHRLSESDVVSRIDVDGNRLTVKF